MLYASAMVERTMRVTCKPYATPATAKRPQLNWVGVGTPKSLQPALRDRPSKPYAHTREMHNLFLGSNGSR